MKVERIGHLLGGCCDREMGARRSGEAGLIISGLIVQSRPS